jgi:AcrR family transcriptional regulator
VSRVPYDLVVPPLSRERILQTAVAMADRDGFEAVTLRRLAGELGVHVTSLYNYLPTGDGITDGIVEKLIEEAKLPRTPVGWEEWVRSFFTAVGTLAVTHPGAFEALQRRPVQGPNAAASFEVALAAFAKAGLGPEDAYGAIKATVLSALGVGLERAVASSGERRETAIEDLPAEDFPMLTLLGKTDTADPEVAWEFALETLVSGLRAQIRRRRERSS